MSVNSHNAIWFWMLERCLSNVKCFVLMSGMLVLGSAQCLAESGGSWPLLCPLWYVSRISLIWQGTKIISLFLFSQLYSSTRTTLGFLSVQIVVNRSFVLPSVIMYGIHLNPSSLSCVLFAMCFRESYTPLCPSWCSVSVGSLLAAWVSFSLRHLTNLWQRHWMSSAALLTTAL